MDVDESRTSALATARPLPFCPPPKAGESLPSWAARIAAANRLPVGLLLARIGVMRTTHHDDIPAGWGIALTERALEDLASASGVDADTIRKTVLTRWNRGPLDLTGADPDVPDSIRGALLGEWCYARGSHYCPDCLREDDGAWALAWRLPWSFACVRHSQLLAAVCPSCGQRASRPRLDGRASPGFLTQVPEPGRCGNAVPGQGRTGRGARPCGHDLTEVRTTSLAHRAAAPILTAQRRLDGLLDSGDRPDVWADLRALGSVLLMVGGPESLPELSGSPELLRTRALHDAVTTYEAARHSQQSARHRITVGGGDGRQGPRTRSWTTAPEDPALLAAVSATALALYGPLPGDDPPPVLPSLDRLAAVTRAHGRQLVVLLRDAHATGALLVRADAAARRTGRFAHAHGPAGRTAGRALEPRHVPALLWQADAAELVACFHGTGTLEITARRFGSLALVKRITGGTWAFASESLGQPADRTWGIINACVSRLNAAATADRFHERIEAIATAAAGRTLVDYAARRRGLRNLTNVPRELVHDAGLRTTPTRRRNSAVWLWADLVGDHPWNAPPWFGDAEEAQREQYRRWLHRDLPRLEAPLRAWGEQLLRELGERSTRPGTDRTDLSDSTNAGDA